MTCPKCRYVMTDFDIDCPRCNRSSVNSSIDSGQIGYLALMDSIPVDPNPVPKQLNSTIVNPQTDHSGGDSQLPPTGIPNGLTPIHKNVVVPNPLFSCPICANENTQKISAIVRDGTWNESTSWSENSSIDTRANEASVGLIWGKHHISPVTTFSAGNSKGQGRTYGHGSSRGSTTLARNLAAPNRPIEPFNDLDYETLGKWMFGVPLLLLIIGGWGLVTWWIIVPTTGLWIWGMATNTMQKQKTFESKKAKFPELLNRWKLESTRWEKLFYCSRCDQVFNPESGRTAPPSNLSSLLRSD